MSIGGYGKLRVFIHSYRKPTVAGVSDMKLCYESEFPHINPNKPEDIFEVITRIVRDVIADAKSDDLTFELWCDGALELAGYPMPGADETDTDLDMEYGEMLFKGFIFEAYNSD